MNTTICKNRNSHSSRGALAFVCAVDFDASSSDNFSDLDAASSFEPVRLRDFAPSSFSTHATIRLRA
ncbi:hypothetical protein LCM4573_16720 [Rhizobium sp. LCM 4573]|nr:hypothetical protein LCM4573_16720 [Rhizobium sp. LCM 4573]